MRVENEFELLKMLYLFIEMNFNHERHRVQLILIMQLTEITSNWSVALLAICYEHVKITLLSNSQEEEWSQVLVKIAYKYTKDYLDEKDL